MSLKFYNSLTESKEDFVPLVDQYASLYVCGPTVYNDSHLGHAKTYVSFDIILRYLRFCGYQTCYVQNITDVGHLLGDSDNGEDKLVKRAQELSVQPMAVAETYTRRHFDVMDKMGVIRPDISPRATGHIPEQLDAIQTLIENDYAYESNGSVYFDVCKDPDYGCLSNRRTEDAREGMRVEVRSEKRNARDFALWKRAEPEHLMRWKDPWSGWGYPGWHTECVVMSTHYLGDTFDIHGGGMELKFPHHDCEIAQASALGKGFARYWLHSNMLTIEGHKMSKSQGNFVTLEDAFERYNPVVVRYFMVASHYRSVVDYSDTALEAGAKSLERLHHVTSELRQRIPKDATPKQEHFQEYRQRFCAAMDDDFSTPQALAVLFDLSREVNTLLHSSNPDAEALIDAEALFTTLGEDVLGIIPESLGKTACSEKKLKDVMELVIALRNRSREQKDYACSDYIRDHLKDINITLKDSRDGTTWE